MATIRSNAVARAFSGSIGHIVFRQLRGKPVISSKPARQEKQSTLQRENRLRFRYAAAWAKGQMRDENKKAYYWRMAKKLKLPNAYTAAVSDYMRKGEIKEVDTLQYKGNAGDVIKMKISKKDFPVNKVNMLFRDASGNIIENGFAIRKKKNLFIYKAMKNINSHPEVHLRVTLTDQPGITIQKDLVIPLLYTQHQN
jgi:hypothetical protein